MGREISVAARRRAWRQEVGRHLARRHDGVVRRSDLLAAGLTDHDVRAEVDRGVWHAAGRHTICIGTDRPRGEGLLWRAIWESGPRAVLDGPSALLAAGLKHWEEPFVHVSLPRNATVTEVPGVRHHHLRKIGPAIPVGLRRTKPEVAVLRGAEWARSDRAATTLVAMTVQQRLVAPSAVLQRWSETARSRRRAVLDLVIRDVCDGAHSLNELDVVRACRARGLPEPSRQQVRSTSTGTVYLDLFWDDYAVHAEVQGAHHLWGLTGVDDAVRGNAVAIGDRGVVSLQIPVLGWRLHPEVFLDQIAAALRESGWAA
ncbi:hypothetical protein [Serinicoccus chungangensis]|uniref:hypothetical protein n=1 Tax=Serinicoccus chungangensis TaxID=767452 RepID=UPI0011191A70|nr:hypothetical protein [Serinicoccus chungangensis]